jgi:metal-responsive CopG/Arc/MetJ family transcriptional regulator
MAKVTISLPDDLLRSIDEQSAEAGLSRSEVIRQALEEMQRAASERAAEAQYIAGYRKHPETSAEVAVATSLSAAAVTDEPW